MFPVTTSVHRLESPKQKHFSGNLIGHYGSEMSLNPSQSRSWNMVASSTGPILIATM